MNGTGRRGSIRRWLASLFGRRSEAKAAESIDPSTADNPDVLPMPAVPWTTPPKSLPRGEFEEVLKFARRHSRPFGS